MPPRLKPRFMMIDAFQSRCSRSHRSRRLRDRFGWQRKSWIGYAVSKFPMLRELRDEMAAHGRTRNAKRADQVLPLHRCGWRRPGRRQEVRWKAESHEEIRPHAQMPDTAGSWPNRF